VARCRQAGIDPVTELVPVTPAAHYASGGLATDLSGRTTVPGLYACGEVACTGVHGANRLASNSLLEGLVFAARIADDLVRALPAAAEPAIDERDAGLLAPQALVGVQAAMTVGAGVLRSADSLAATAAALARIGGRAPGSDGRSADPGDPVEPCVEAWQATNVHTVASALVTGAQLRAETRGCHWREDFPRASDAWLGHLVTQLSPDGTPSTSFHPAPEAAFQPAATS